MNDSNNNISISNNISRTHEYSDSDDFLIPCPYCRKISAASPLLPTLLKTTINSLKRAEKAEQSCEMLKQEIHELRSSTETWILQLIYERL